MSTRPADPNDPRAALYQAIAAAYHASQAYLRAEAQYGRGSAEVAAAHEALRVAQETLMRRERAYLHNARERAARRGCDQTTETDSAPV